LGDPVTIIRLTSLQWAIRSSAHGEQVSQINALVQAPSTTSRPWISSPVKVSTLFFSLSLPSLALTMALSAPAAAAEALCLPEKPAGPLFITPDCTDPQLINPYTDIDEMRSTTDRATGVTVHYRYIHGGFEGSNSKFSLYYPVESSYRDWFIQLTYPLVANEAAEDRTIAFAISHGAYVVSTNNNGGTPAGGDLVGYRTNAAAAKFSRIQAQKIYERRMRPRGFISGASGGAYQTLGAVENTSGIWDGSVPMVPGVPNAIPSFQVSQMLGLRVLASVLPGIADAVAPGGSGNPYAGLDAQQAATLREVSRLGFPLRGWWQYASMNGGAFLAVQGGVQAIDPNYVHDFWAMPGYEGGSGELKALRVEATTTILGHERGNRLTVAHVPKGNLLNADLVVEGGPLAGARLKIIGGEGNILEIAQSNGALNNSELELDLKALTKGTNVRIDNSASIALQYYSRHQVPDPAQYGWNQYRGEDGKPVFPQREVLVGPLMNAGSAGGSMASGQFHGKMIMLASTMDIQAYPWSADWYRKTAANVKGDRLDSDYRLWIMDNADHDPKGPNASAAANVDKAAHHIVSYEGEYEQALLYLNDWVSKGAAPPESTRYSVSDDNQIKLASTPSRHGVQPLVELAVGERQRIDLKVGEPVNFRVRAEVPPEAGKVVDVEWDLLGSGHYVSKPRVMIAQAPISRLYGFRRSATVVNSAQTYPRSLLMRRFRTWGP
jgi:hypothetical protein